MGKIKTVELTGAQRAALEKGYRDSESHAFPRALSSDSRLGSCASTCHPHV